MNLFCTWMNVDFSDALQVQSLPTVQVWRELKIASATDVWILAAKPKPSATAFAEDTDSDREKSVLTDALPRNRVGSPMSLLQGSGLVQLLSPVLFSIHLCFILLAVKKTHICRCPPPPFYFFSSQWSIRWSWEVSHGCVSLILDLHVHTQETLIFVPRAKPVEFIISQNPQNAVGRTRLSFKICLPVLSRNAGQLCSGSVHSAGHFITQNTSATEKLLPEGPQALFKGSPLPQLIRRAIKN